MSIDLTQEFAKGGATGFATGTICNETSLYKCTDNRMQFIELVEVGAPFPPYPGGKGTSKATWYRLTKSGDGAKAGFTSVVVVEGAA